MPKISAMIITYNEAANIKECLERIKWADQIVVADTGSTDQTVKLAREYTAQVYQIPRSDFSNMRNEALKHISGDWLLMLDADERVSLELAAEIQVLLQNPDQDGYVIPFCYYFLGKPIRHGEWGIKYNKKLRLVKFSHTLRFEGVVHEKLNFKGTKGELKHPIDHYFYNSIEQYVTKHNLYTTFEAEKYAVKKKKVGLVKLIYRPVIHFGKNYFIKRGFLDGSYGFILCCLSSFSVFLRTLKMWYLFQQRKAGTETMK